MQLGMELGHLRPTPAVESSRTFGQLDGSTVDAAKNFPELVHVRTTYWET